MGKRSIEIASRFPKYKKIIGAEIGVRFGKNAEQLLDLLPNLTLHMIDRWEKPPAGDSYYNSGDGIADRPAGHLLRARKQCAERIERFGYRAKMITSESAIAAARYPNEFFDFVFVDADHSYEGSKRDSVIWLPKVKPGGYICGHDYNHPKIGEVKKAIDELFGDLVEIGEDMTWFVKIA